MKPTDLFRDESGYTTVGTLLALLLSLSLVFTSAQVFAVESKSAEVQNVADAAALAAENQVAEFYIVAHVCDAVAFSLSLTGVLSIGAGIAALCTPPTAVLGEQLISAGKRMLSARDTFVEKATEGLNRYQSVLPMLVAANALSVARANESGAEGQSYVGFAILVPSEARAATTDSITSAYALAENVSENQDDIEDAARRAEEACEVARQEKEKAFAADCGNTPGYCMYERASHLAGLTGSDNPLYKTVDTWSFSVALARAQAYYQARLASETPASNEVGEQARSALRTRFYRYAVERMAEGYVYEDGDVFEAYFPLLPRSTAEMRETELYTENAYPLSSTNDGYVLHAWDGCPQLLESGSCGLASIERMELEQFASCASCEFSAASLGKVAAASTSIENGFEYHYVLVAEAAEAYERAINEASPYKETTKSLVDELFDDIEAALADILANRIEVSPPGSSGAIACVAALEETAADTWFSSSFVNSSATLKTRVAFSAASLASDDATESASVISALLSNVEASAGVVGSVASGTLGLWSSALYFYTEGVSAVESGLDSLFSGMPLISESGLGTWAAKRFASLVNAAGLSPPTLYSLKPVTVNTAHVLLASESEVSKRLLEAKRKGIELGQAADSTLYGTAVSLFGASATSALASLSEGIEIAVIQPFGEDGPSVPLTLSLPSWASSAATSILDSFVEKLRLAYSSATGVRQWE